MKKTLYIAIIAVLTSVSCSTVENDNVRQATAPTNFQIETKVVDATLGIVEVNVSADGANFYRVEFFERNESEIVDVENNIATYDYNTTGTHKIAARAYSSFEAYTELIDSITIRLPSDSVLPTTGYSTPLSYPGYTLVWNDEFNGSQLSSDWTHEIGTGNNGWGNNELQYYTNRNTEVRDGILRITARKEPTSGQQYSSSRIVTQGNQSFKYGRIDIRASLPFGQGLWPALWMLGDNFPTAGWPDCGEIDIMEMVGGPSRNNGGDNKVHGTLHWDNNGSYASTGGSNQLSSGRFSDEFHVFTIIWTDQRITWYRDDIEYYHVNTTAAAMSEFQEKYFFIFNVAVGGNWPGSPNSNTTFPQTMAVDYVRVFQK
jgi:beta-glucanase (GH16 family)